MTEAFEKELSDELGRRYFNGYERDKFSAGAKWAAQAILTAPGLLWPEGQKWMSDDEVMKVVTEYAGPTLHDEESPSVGRAIRDLAQQQFDALWGTVDAQNAEIAQLWGELDKARERVRELEQKLDNHIGDTGWYAHEQ